MKGEPRQAEAAHVLLRDAVQRLIKARDTCFGDHMLPPGEERRLSTDTYIKKE